MIPLYLRDETCVAGMLVLLVICLQVLTLMEFVLRRNLDGDVLEGLYTSNPRKKTDRPTAERILELFKEITLYYVLIGEQRLSLFSPLTPLQKRVLTLLELPLAVYEGFKSRH
jgi:transposase